MHNSINFQEIAATILCRAYPDQWKLSAAPSGEHRALSNRIKNSSPA